MGVVTTWDTVVVTTLDIVMETIMVTAAATTQDIYGGGTNPTSGAGNDSRLRIQ